VCPSRQTLDLAQFECETCRTQSRIVEPLLPRVARCFGALNDTRVASARAVRPLAAGEPTATRHRLLLHRRGLSVLRRPAHYRFGSEESSTLLRLQSAVSSFRQSVNTTNKQPEVPSVMRSCNSLALRSTVAPGCSGHAGIGFAHAGGAGALDHGITQREIQTGQAVSSPARSNPSIEGTHNGGARLRASSPSAAPSCAPHVKR
jgi:hypothetical protein